MHFDFDFFIFFKLMFTMKNKQFKIQMTVKIKCSNDGPPVLQRFLRKFRQQNNIKFFMEMSKTLFAIFAFAF